VFIDVYIYVMYVSSDRRPRDPAHRGCHTEQDSSARAREKEKERERQRENARERAREREKGGERWGERDKERANPAKKN